MSLSAYRQHEYSRPVLTLLSRRLSLPALLGCFRPASSNVRKYAYNRIRTHLRCRTTPLHTCSFNKYISIAARATVQALKEEPRVKAEKRITDMALRWVQRSQK